MRKLLSVFIVILLALPSADGDARKPKGDGGKIDVSGERPFDAVNIFGDFGRNFRLLNTEENKLWWERMVRGEVGKDRFLILCALKNGNWKNLGDIRTYIEFKIQGTYSANSVQTMLVLMASRSKIKYPRRGPINRKGKIGEGWLERDPRGGPLGIDSEWRIEPSVYPLLYFLLMGCPEDDRCE